MTNVNVARRFSSRFLVMVTRLVVLGSEFKLRMVDYGLTVDKCMATATCVKCGLLFAARIILFTPEAKVVRPRPKLAKAETEATNVEAKATILALRLSWPRGLNITVVAMVTHFAGSLLSEQLR